jgi:hypothetical protein
MSKEKTMNKKRILGILLMILLIGIFWQSIAEWILNLAISLIGLWELVKFLEMPHKFYGLTIILFISWKILETVINLWIKGIEYSIKLIRKDALQKTKDDNNVGDKK